MRDIVNRVFVLDQKGKPLMPCKASRAHRLLEKGRAVIHSHYPFAIRLKDKLAKDCKFQDIIVKYDPGASHTGIAIVRESIIDGYVIHYVLMVFQLDHRGDILTFSPPELKITGGDSSFKAYLSLIQTTFQRSTGFTSRASHSVV